MKSVTKIETVGTRQIGGYIIYLNDSSAWLQRFQPVTASDSPLNEYEKVILALCDKLAERRESKS